MPSLEDDEDAKAVKQDAGDIPPIVQHVSAAPPLQQRRAHRGSRGAPRDERSVRVGFINRLSYKGHFASMAWGPRASHSHPPA